MKFILLLHPIIHQQYNCNMTEDFDNSIFGELVEPKQVNLKQCSLPSSIINYDQHKNQDYNKLNECTNLVRSGQKSLERISEVCSNLWKSGKDADQHNFSEKELSNKSTEVGSEYMQSSVKKVPALRKIDSHEVFKCLCRQADRAIQKGCLACKGKGSLEGSNNMIKFIQYVMDFKAGLQPSYCIEAHESTKNCQREEQKNEGTRLLCRKQQQTECFHNFKDFNQKMSQQYKEHLDFGCNECGSFPIIGTRYHCNDDECDNDFDLCQACYLKSDHEHEMEEIKESTIVKKLKLFGSVAPRETKTVDCKSIKIFSSSIC